MKTAIRRDKKIPKEELIQSEGLVIEILPDARYRVQLDAGNEVVAYTAGKMHIQRVGNGAPHFELAADASARRLPTLLPSQQDAY